MGNILDSLFSNSKEREFTKNPLSDKKINDLVNQKPNFDVEPVYESEKILERPDEEKILRGMTGQKIFNIKGDSIFEYYFTHHRNEIRNCMKSHINRVNTPCPDENFNKMIKTIPDLVLGPLEEKQSQWDTEKDSMQKQFNEEKKELQKKYNILENKYYEVEGDYESVAQDYSNCDWHRSKEARINWKQQEKYNALKKKYDLLQSERDNFNENCDSASQKGSVTKENSNLRKQLDEIEKKLKYAEYLADARSQALKDLMPEMERQYETITRLENQLKNC